MTESKSMDNHMEFYIQSLKEENQKLFVQTKDIMQMIDDVTKENERLRKQVEFNEKYGIYSNAMKEIERLRKGIERIEECTDCVATRVEAMKLLES